MIKNYLVGFAVLLIVGATTTTTHAEDSWTVSSGNSSLKVTLGDPYNVGGPSDPIKSLDRLEWTVNGRRILVYPGVSFYIDSSNHFHPDSHVTDNAIHAQGPILGYATNQIDGLVVGGVVYSVVGGPPGSSQSRIWEKLDIRNKSLNPQVLPLNALGVRPRSSLEQPDLSGLTLRGRTMVFSQGSHFGFQIADAPQLVGQSGFAPVDVTDAVDFSRFNPLSRWVTINPGATLTVVTVIDVTLR